MNSFHALDLLDDQLPALPRVCALVGEDRFLKRLLRNKIRQSAAEDGDPTQLEGGKTQWRDVIDELSTLSLFGGGPRIVFIDEADEFVSENRSRLEELTTNSGAGTLVLDLKSLASNTRLYKGIVAKGMIVECRPPQTTRGRSTRLDEPRLRKWLRDWGRSTHHVQLKSGADEELLHLVGPHLGLLDQGLAKLALFVPRDGEVTAELVREVVGGWRAKTSWELLDAALDGNAAEALRQLERLIQSGEATAMIAGAVLWSVRRFADAAELVMEAEAAGRRITLTAALEQAGIRKWPQGALQRAERQLRQMGRRRAGQLYQQLLQLDLSLKGSHAAPHRARWALEKFILSLAREAA